MLNSLPLHPSGALDEGSCYGTKSKRYHFSRHINSSCCVYSDIHCARCGEDHLQIERCSHWGKNAESLRLVIQPGQMIRSADENVR